MITAIDSCVLVDILCDDPHYAERSIAAVSRAQQEGKLIISDLVIAEVSPAAHGAIENFLTDLDVSHVPNTREVAFKAGETFQDYLQRGGKGGRIVPDFLIGHHALAFADRLLTRDNGFQRDYFKNLNIWYPEN